jgi:hypothetical protein
VALGKVGVGPPTCRSVCAEAERINPSIESKLTIATTKQIIFLCHFAARLMFSKPTV